MPAGPGCRSSRPGGAAPAAAGGAATAPLRSVGGMRAVLGPRPDTAVPVPAVGPALGGARCPCGAAAFDAAQDAFPRRLAEHFMGIL